MADGCFYNEDADSIQKIFTQNFLEHYTNEHGECSGFVGLSAWEDKNRFYFAVSSQTVFDKLCHLIFDLSLTDILPVFHL